MKVYRIVDWSRHYECNRTREVKNAHWVPVPVKQDGYGYCVLTAQNGAARLGAWLAILQTAAKSQVRGTLLRDGRTPHTAETIAMKARIDAEPVRETLEVCTHADVGWIEVVDIAEDGQITVLQPAGLSQETAGLSQETAGLSRYRTGQDKTLQNKTEDSSDRFSNGREPPHRRVKFDYSSGQFSGIEPSDMAVLTEAYPAVNHEAEIQKARAWLLANPTKRKKNVWGFLTRWMNSTQERSGNREIGRTSRQHVSQQAAERCTLS